MRVHIISNSIYMKSGYSNVAKYLGLGLQKLGYDITMTGMQTAYEIDNRFGIVQYPIQTNSVDETGQILMNLRTVNPDVVICIFQSDDPSLLHIPTLFKKTIFYTTIEGARVPTYSMRVFDTVINNGGKIVVPTVFGKHEIEKEADRFRVEASKIRIKENVHVIPYGYNDKIFRPGIHYLNNKEIVSFLKWDNKNNRWSQHNVSIGDMLFDSSFKGKFVYAQIGQNIGVRKRFERLLKAYSILISESQTLKDRTVLHIHTLPVSAQGLNLMDECEILDIQNNISFSYGDFRSSGWSEETLCALINRFDCHCSASSAEGFSLPCLETMACGIVNIAPRYTSFPELIGEEVGKERGLLAELDTIQMTESTSYKGLVSEKDLARNMKEMYTDKHMRKKYSDSCLSFVKDFTWDKQIDKWDKYLKDFIK